MKKIGWEGSTGRLSLVVMRKKNVPEIFCFAHSADEYLHLIKVLGLTKKHFVVSQLWFLLQHGRVFCLLVSMGY